MAESRVQIVVEHVHEGIGPDIQKSVDGINVRKKTFGNTMA